MRIYDVQRGLFTRVNEDSSKQQLRNRSELRERASIVRNSIFPFIGVIAAALALSLPG
jgi:hypothetical protein